MRKRPLAPEESVGALAVPVAAPDETVRRQPPDPLESVQIIKKVRVRPGGATGVRSRAKMFPQPVEPGRNPNGDLVLDVLTADEIVD